MRKFILGTVMSFGMIVGLAAAASAQTVTGGFGVGVGSSTSQGYVTSYGNGGAASSNQGFVDTSTGVAYNGNGFSTESSVQTGNENNVSTYGTGFGSAQGTSSGFTDTAGGVVSFSGFNPNCW